MNSSLVNSVAVSLMFMMALWGIVCFFITLIEYLQNWLTARKNINTEVPALKSSIEELRRRQSRLETEWEQVRRRQDSTSLNAQRG